jgi:hypothetical protein
MPISPEGRLGRIARFHADQQEVERVGKGARDRLAALGRLVPHVEDRRVEAEEADDDADRCAQHRPRALQEAEAEDVGHGQEQEEDGEADAREEEDRQGVLGPEARDPEVLDRLLVGERPFEIQRLDDLGRDAGVGAALAAPLALLGGQPRPFAGAHLVALDRHRLHPPAQLVSGQHGQGEGDERQEDRERGQPSDEVARRDPVAGEKVHRSLRSRRAGVAPPAGRRL